MKIILFNPPVATGERFIREGRCVQSIGVWSTLWPPITLTTVAALLESRGHEVVVHDCAAEGMTISELLRHIQMNGFDLAVWSSGTTTIKSDLGLAEKIKDVNPGTKTGVLGTHVTALTEECLQSTPHLDFIIRNEPEETIAELSEVLNVSETQDLCLIKGLSFRLTDNRVQHAPDRPFLDPGCLPFPAWHLIDLNKYRLPFSGRKFLCIAPIRGCPYSCTFCTAKTYYGRRLRTKPISRLMEEVEYNIEHFGIKDFFIWADTFTMDRRYVLDFCQVVSARGLSIRWTCNSRVDTVDKPMLQSMAKAGCWMISFGIESANDEVLKRCRKNITTDQAVQAVRWAAAAGLKTVGHFILGLPGETEESLKQTIQFARRIDLDIAQFYCASPFPGSDLYREAVENRWLVPGMKKDVRQETAIMDLPGLTAAQVNQYRKKAFMRFYLRPKALWKIARFILGVRPGAFLTNGLRFLRWVMS